MAGRDSAETLEKTGERDERLVPFASATLDSIETIAGRAERELARGGGVSQNSLAHLNSLNDSSAIQTLGDIGGKARHDYDTLAREPAIARLLIRDEVGEDKVLFIARAAPPAGLLPGISVASYLSPKGRMAAMPVGKECIVFAPGGEQSYEIREKALLKTAKSLGQWDSTDTVLSILGQRPKTIFSLRALLEKKPEEEDDDALLAALLRGDPSDETSMDGVRRRVLTKMGLRDRPILDEFQDAIFRLPLDSSLAIMGPPGTGKTTTLIKRLAQKVNLEYLTEEEQKLVQRGQGGGANHATSWLVFTPTELLRQYVKEAFAQEGVAAPDSNIKTWDDERRALARDTFNILKTATRAGAVLHENRYDNLLPETVHDQINWSDDFDTWQRESYLVDLNRQHEILRRGSNQELSGLSVRIGRALSNARPEDILDTLEQLDQIAPDAAERAAEIRKAVDAELRTEFAAQLRQDKELLDKLLAFLGTLSDDEPDEEEDEDVVDDDGDNIARPGPAKMRSMPMCGRCAYWHGRRPADALSEREAATGKSFNGWANGSPHMSGSPKWEDSCGRPQHCGALLMPLDTM